VITATLGGVKAKGSLAINSLGAFTHAPTPSKPSANVISIFSDAYTNVPVEYYNGYWAPYQTTQSANFNVNGDAILNYTNFNFVGIQFSKPTINASTMTHLHIDLYIPNTLFAGELFTIQVVDFGADGVYGGGDDTSASLTYTSPTKLVSKNWVSFDIPFTSLPGLTSRAHLAQIIFSTNINNISNFYADNIFFYHN